MSLRQPSIQQKKLSHSDLSFTLRFWPTCIQKGQWLKWASYFYHFLKERWFHNNISNNTPDFVCSVFEPISCWVSVSEQFPGDSIFFFLKHFPDIISLGNRRKGGEKWYLLQKQSWGLCDSWEASYDTRLWLPQSLERFMCCWGSWLSTGYRIPTYFTVL